MQQNLQKKRGLVKKVFDNVYNKYDLMNDFMSLGIHRQWKRELIRQMNPYPESSLIDVACGTGDIAELFLKHVSKLSKVTCVDPNEGMISKGKNKLSKFKNINWINAPAEKIPLYDNLFDFYTISFGLRNTAKIHKAIAEAYRVLKPGGRIMILEFSSVNNDLISWFYDKYSFNTVSYTHLTLPTKA